MSDTVGWRSYLRYCTQWENYKSDKHKTKAILREEIRDLLVYGTYTKEDLVKLKETVKDVAFREVK